MFSVWSPSWREPSQKTPRKGRSILFLLKTWYIAHSMNTVLSVRFQEVGTYDGTRPSFSCTFAEEHECIEGCSHGPFRVYPLSVKSPLHPLLSSARTLLHKAKWKAPSLYIGGRCDSVARSRSNVSTCCWVWWGSRSIWQGDEKMLTATALFLLRS